MKRVGIYGVSGVGKTTVVDRYKNEFVGITTGGESEGIKAYFGGNFHDFLALEEQGRQNARERALSAYFSKLSITQGVVVIDAHYSFWVDGALIRVIPSASEEFYTHFIYLNPGAEEILRRQRAKSDEDKFSLKQVNEWVEYEISGLEQVCRAKRRTFYQIKNVNLVETVSELNNIVTG